MKHKATPKARPRSHLSRMLRLALYLCCAHLVSYNHADTNPRPSALSAPAPEASYHVVEIIGQVEYQVDPHTARQLLRVDSILSEHAMLFPKQRGNASRVHILCYQSNQIITLDIIEVTSVANVASACQPTPTASFGTKTPLGHTAYAELSLAGRYRVNILRFQRQCDQQQAARVVAEAQQDFRLSRSERASLRRLSNANPTEATTEATTPCQRPSATH